MTRINTQIEEMRKELAAYENMAVDCMQRFYSVESEFKIILKNYKINTYDAESNTFVDKSIFDNHLRFRMYIQVDLSKLTAIQKKNLEFKLRDILSLTCSAINDTRIEVVYS